MSPHTLLLGLLFAVGAVVGLWAAQVVPSTRPDAVLAALAHLTGLLAGLGMLVAVLLTARVPALEHGIGADVLARRHARAGRVVIGLTSAHALFAVGAYMSHTGTGVFDAVRALAAYPALAAAMSGTALLVAVAVVSARSVRARVRHETWRGVHLLTYAGVTAGFFHQPAGPDLAGAPVPAWLWTLLHAQVAVLVIWYRILVPLRAAWRHDIRVVAVRDEAPDVVSVLMRGRDLASLNTESGQFFRWRFLTRGLWRTSLPFSVSAPVHHDTMRVTVKVVGDHTRRIRRLRPGVRVVATGPFGAMTARRRTRRKVLLIAGGVGITPMRALFETLPGAPGDVTLMYRAGDKAHLVLRAELERIAARRGFSLYCLTGPSGGPGDPLSPANLRLFVPGVDERDVYLCGPPGMTRATVRALRRAGVPDRQIHTEDFAF